jgi:ankyrin repeat protein
MEKNIKIEEEIMRICKSGDMDELKNNMEKIRPHFNIIIPVICGYGYLEVAKIIREYGGDLRCNNDNALGNAGKYGRTEMVKYLIEEVGVDVSAQKYYGFLYACKGNHIETVRVYLDNKTNPNIRDNMAVCIAVEHGHVELLKLLLEHGGTWGHNEESLVTYCVVNGSIECLKILIDNGMDVGPFFGGESDLHIYAASLNHFEVALELLEHGYNANICDDKILDWACLYGRLDVIDKMESSTTFDWLNRTGTTIIWATKNNHYDVVKRCIERGVPTTIKKCRAISEAVLNKNEKIIELLMNHTPNNTIPKTVWGNIIKEMPEIEESYKEKAMI